MLYDPENSSLTPLAYETIMGGDGKTRERSTR